MHWFGEGKRKTNITEKQRFRGENVAQWQSAYLACARACAQPTAPKTDKGKEA